MNNLVRSLFHSPVTLFVTLIIVTLSVTFLIRFFSYATQVHSADSSVSNDISKVVAQVQTDEISEYLVYRSEYEAANDFVYDINDPNEGTVKYSIVSGNDYNYYKIDSSTGVITFASEIPDVVGETRKDMLVISAQSDNYQKKYKVVVVDGYDYFIETHPEYKILVKNQEILSLPGNPYTAYNNLHGQGKAVLNKDFRMSVLVDTSVLPNKTVFIWDTPSEARAFNGGSIWSYVNLFWGNRSGVREDLAGYPFKVGDLKKLSIDFDFEKLYGTDHYKIALNNFFTKESTLQPFQIKTGDFFFVFDQVGTYLPKYQVTMPDVTLGGNPFAVLYNKNPENGYETRRVIIKDDAQWVSGTLDLLSIYKLFIDKGYMDANQYIPNIQIGIEVTKGFAAVRVNKWDIKME